MSCRQHCSPVSFKFDRREAEGFVHNMSIQALLNTPITGPNVAATLREWRQLAMVLDADLHAANETVRSIPTAFRGSRDECAAHARAFQSAIQQLGVARRQAASFCSELALTIRAAQQRDRASLLVED